MDSLSKQTVSLDKIIVINNNSSDGTTEWLKHQSSFEVIHQGNVGGAGGFKRGMLRAQELTCDFMWLMDDDVEPELDCLEKILRAESLSPIKYGILLPDRYRDKEKKQRWVYGLEFNFTNPLKPLSLKSVSARQERNNAILEISGLTFEGPLIRKEVIDRVGVVDDRYFIIHDDTDFAIRSLREGYRIGLCTEAIINRKIFENGGKQKKSKF